MLTMKGAKLRRPPMSYEQVILTLTTLLALTIPWSSAFSSIPRTPKSLQNSRLASALDTTDLESSSKGKYVSDVIIKSQVLGDIQKIRILNNQSFLGAMQVPTFVALGEESITTRGHREEARGLEGVLRQGPAFVLDNVLSKDTCQALIDNCEELGFKSFRAGKNHHGALQILVSQEIADSVAQVLARHINVNQVGSNLVFAGLNRRWRIYRYEPGGEETFKAHIDASFPPSGLAEDGTLEFDDSPPDVEVVSHLTVLMYLNDDFIGGETKFYQPSVELADEEEPSQVIASVRPVEGSLLVFTQAVGIDAVKEAQTKWPLHEGAPVTSGTRPKYVIRSDVLFATQPEAFVAEDEKHLFQYDHSVRETFIPQSPVFDGGFLSHLSSLYNPHMGVENCGPLLYSFVRFTKVKQVVEIGAGYTSLWILQALKDNDDDWRKIQDLQKQGKCRLMDIEWTIEGVVEEQTPAKSSLLCIDNCLHQKETATGAAAVAKSLGLGDFMKFNRGDAFDLTLENESIDLLWCDFGAGSRMKEFVSKAWSSIRPGGFLLCHSTLTNKRTREWLESVRARRGEEETGIASDEYAEEVSLLEPHKRYQNSISILQKRKGSNGKSYDEPIYSEYA